MRVSQSIVRVGMIALGVCAGSAFAQQQVRPAANQPPAKKATDKPADQPADQPAKKHAEKPIERPTAKPTSRGADSPLVAAPHPLITEVLFAVPSGGDGDCNLDGTRHATGDEFIELVNPHDVAINLKGYRLTEGQVQTRKGETREKKPGGDASDENRRDNQTGKHANDHDDRLELTFPELVLEPGEVVVVFNGFEASMTGEVGTREKAANKNELFHNAYVFTFDATSKYHALSNTNDMVQLIAPDGTGVQGISWDFRKKNDAKTTQPSTQTTNQPASNERDAKDDAPSKPASRPGTIRGNDRSKPQAPNKRAQLPKHADVAIELLEQLTDSTWREGSVQRETKSSELRPHLRIDGRLASPGQWDGKAKSEK